MLHPKLWYFFLDFYSRFAFRSYIFVLYKYALVEHPDIYIQDKYTKKKCSENQLWNKDICDVRVHIAVFS